MPFTPGAVLLTLSASLSYGSFDAVRKKLANTLQPLPLTALLGLGQALFFAVWTLSSGATLPLPGYLPQAAASITFSLVGNLLFMRALQVSPLSLTIPFLSFSPVFTALFSGALLGEFPRSIQALGIAWVVLGAFLLNLAKEDLASPTHFLRGVTRERGCLLMLGAALVWALGSIFDKRALVYASVPLHALVQSLGIALAILFLLLLRRDVGSLGNVRHCRGLYAVAIVVASLAQGLQLLALPLVVVSLYEAIKRCIGMTLAVINGALFFGEPVTPRKLLSIALMGTGVVFILA
ncbi:EamA family transporter [Hyalangium rubrum]|uniref:EamA family transporter n=1 Tax=Hyalangium rubrum TaxID=3103134 RepID=A0ABU5H304_9BACT|nr:EamA family transporter [Hyalangium sp. s54d21]MDY7227279.1 EamA family transporter [Hyalangium sp. s54d21]